MSADTETTRMETTEERIAREREEAAAHLGERCRECKLRIRGLGHFQGMHHNAKAQQHE